jgi:hypothetical protein
MIDEFLKTGDGGFEPKMLVKIKILNRYSHYENFVSLSMALYGAPDFVEMYFKRPT